jgi:hypothetical protein
MNKFQISKENIVKEFFYEKLKYIYIIMSYKITALILFNGKNLIK